MTAPIDPARATVSRLGDGSVQFADPDSPWLVRIWPDLDGGRRIGALRVDVRDPAAPVTVGRLASLPLAHLLHVATVGQIESGSPDETFYRMLARPKPRGQRSWDPDHYDRVLQVRDWAIRTKRPGGGSQAVADMWHVARDPTAHRWLREARRRATRPTA